MAQATHTHPTYGPVDIRERSDGVALVGYVGSPRGAACRWDERPIPRQAVVPVAELTPIG